ncbi:hypothetical protein Tco_0415836 [Tanacetum coccineum]
MSLRRLGYNVIASLAVFLIGLGGLELSEFDHDPQRVCPQHQLPLSAIRRSHSRSSSLAVTSSGLSFGVSDAGLPSEKVVASGAHALFTVARLNIYSCEGVALTGIFAGTECDLPRPLRKFGSSSAHCGVEKDIALGDTLLTFAQ